MTTDPNCAPFSRKASKEVSFKTNHALALASAVNNVLKQYGCKRVLKIDKKIIGLQEALYLYYQKKFKDIPYMILMKQIKHSICSFYSRKTRQEIPEGKSFCLIPHFVMRWFNTKMKLPGSEVCKFSLKTRRRMRIKYSLLHSLLQCKSILPGPKREHIEEIYQKHAKTMSKPALITPQYILDKAYQRGKEFGKIVNEYYNPLKTLPPSLSATFDATRGAGGQRGQLFKTVNSDLSAFRVEPSVLFICGKPGIGKSRLVMNLCRRLCIKENFNIRKSIYTRNCNIEHWDGYNGQPIVVLDDWAQQYNKQTDLVELVSLVTDNCYPLPMADLKEKGTIFTSKYIILCSNLDPRSSSELSISPALRTVRDNRALIRRLEIPILLKDARYDTVSFYSLEKEFRSAQNFERLVDLHELCKPLDLVPQCVSRIPFCESICSLLILSQKRKQRHILTDLPELGIDYPWLQEMFNVEDNICLPNGKLHKISLHQHIEFPGCPPSELPAVRTCAVTKALGSRMVTCAVKETRCLKPLQVAMWKALGKYKHFLPTHGVDLQECYNSLGTLNDQEFLLSGDYESATDNLNMDFSNAILEGILSCINHEPTKLWARWENGTHIIHYPQFTQIEPVEQKTGQLMGSLLSFPLLCLANEIIVSLAGIKKMIINGDDLLCHSTNNTYQKWKELGSSVGLIPSIGKNFVSKEFGTFNSQLFVNNCYIPYTNLKLVQREFQHLSIDDCFSKAIDNGIQKSLIVRNNYKLLKNNPRSIDIPISFGGLGSSFDKRVTMKDRLCYLYDLSYKQSKSILPNSLLPEGYIWLTYPHVGSESGLKDNFDIEDIVSDLTMLKKNQLLLSGIQTFDSIQRDAPKPTDRILNFRKLNKLRKKLSQNLEIRDFIRHGNLALMPPLDSIKFITIPVIKDCKIQLRKNIIKNLLVYQNLKDEEKKIE